MVKTNLNVGCLVKIKPYSDLLKIGIKGPETNIPYTDDVGIVVQVLNNYVVVLWQRLAREGNHFPHTLDKIAD